MRPITPKEEVFKKVYLVKSKGTSGYVHVPAIFRGKKVKIKLVDNLEIQKEGRVKLGDALNKEYEINNNGTITLPDVLLGARIKLQEVP